jgi:hypothetical protein
MMTTCSSHCSTSWQRLACGDIWRGNCRTTDGGTEGYAICRGRQNPDTDNLRPLIAGHAISVTRASVKMMRTALSLLPPPCVPTVRSTSVAK